MDGTKTFCQYLKEKTRAIHDESDKLVNLKLAVVLTDPVLYGQVLKEFYYVYLTIENALEECRDDPLIAPLVLRGLFRAEAFEKDLEFYLGSGWKELKPSQCTSSYCDRIVTVSQEQPVLLIAYAHSMYLAILAGGQILKRIIQRTLGLREDTGLAIFSHDVSDRQELKKQFMENINNLELTDDQKEEIVQEKMRVFRMNNAIANNIQIPLKAYKRISIFVVLILFIIGICVLLLKVFYP